MAYADLVDWHYTFQTSQSGNGPGKANNVDSETVVSIQVVGITAGAIVNVEGSIDNANWVPIAAMNFGSGLTTSAINADGIWLVPVPGIASLRARTSNNAAPINVVGSGLTESSAVGIMQAGQPIRIAAGSAAPGQTLKTFTGKIPLSNGGTTTTNLYTVTAGKTFYITDINLGSDGTSALDIQIQAAGVTIFRSIVKGDTAPLVMPGIETQPTAAGGNIVSILWPTTTTVNGSYFISGFEQ